MPLSPPSPTHHDADASLSLWRETAGGSATLINLSENHTFRVDVPGGGRFILRVHRPGYHDAVAIRSELEWLGALRVDTGLPVPRPIPGSDGDLLQALQTAAGPRDAVLFAFEPGSEPGANNDDLAGLFETLGSFAAIAHRHAEGFVPSPSFSRPRWSGAAILDPDGIWGNWRQAPGVDGEIADILRALDARLRSDLASYGEGRDRFGLIHADMRLANLLVDGDRVTLIDFDDCGFGWFMYDFAAAISFHEANSRAPAWRQRWLAGYQRLRRLTPDDLAAIDAMILLRRLALLAWIGSHGETELAQAHASNFAAVTAELAMPHLTTAAP